MIRGIWRSGICHVIHCGNQHGPTADTSSRIHINDDLAYDRVPFTIASAFIKHVPQVIKVEPQVLCTK